MIYNQKTMRKVSQVQQTRGLLPFVMQACQSLVQLVYSVFILVLGGMMNSAQTFDELLPMDKQENTETVSPTKLYSMDVPVEATAISCEPHHEVLSVAPSEELAHAAGAKKRKNSKAKKNKKHAKDTNEAAATNVSISPLLTPRASSPAPVEPVTLVAALEKSLATQTTTATPAPSFSVITQEKNTKQRSRSSSRSQAQQQEQETKKVEAYPKSVLKRTCPNLKTITAATRQQQSHDTVVRPVRQPLTPPVIGARGFSQQYRQSRSVTQQ